LSSAKPIDARYRRSVSLSLNPSYTVTMGKFAKELIASMKQAAAHAGGRRSLRMSRGSEIAGSGPRGDMTKIGDLKKRLLKDPEVRKAYDALEEEFARGRGKPPPKLPRLAEVAEFKPHVALKHSRPNKTGKPRPRRSSRPIGW
jgi:hypothetical protein